GWVRDIAGIDGQEPVALAVGVADIAILPPHAEADVIAVPPRVEHADRGADHLLRVGHAPKAPKLVDEHLTLHGELRRIITVLPLAAAADAEIRATGLDPRRRASEDIDHPARRVVALPPLDLNPHLLARQGIGDEDDFAVEAPDRIAPE